MKIKNNSGVTLITLIITIVVILVLAAITMQRTSDMPDKAHYTKYMQVMKDIQTGIENVKVTNARKGTTEEKLTKGFKKVNIGNVPIDFVSFDGYEETTGYIVNLKTIGYEEAEYGRAYKEYESGDKTLEFGNEECDVYVFDADWTVYYVKGLEYDDSMNYTFK